MSTTQAKPAVKSSALTDTIFMQSGTRFSLSPKGNRGTEHEVLPPGNYTVQFSPFAGYYLELIASFPKLKKIYGDASQVADRILRTYQNKGGNLGVLLDGLKGSGKTLTSREVCIRGAEMGIPSLIINEPHHGPQFFQFLYGIQQQCIVLFDEFEKVYDDEQQTSLLTVLDGTFPSSKLFLLTSNDQSKINSHLKNRPGRIHYHFNYPGLTGSFIKEYTADVLKNKAHEGELMAICSAFQPMNFDSLSALIWEMNLHNESAIQAIKNLNIKPETADASKYTPVLIMPGATEPVSDKVMDFRAVNYAPITPFRFTQSAKIPLSIEDAARHFNMDKARLQTIAGNFFEDTRIEIEASISEYNQKEAEDKAEYEKVHGVGSYAATLGTKEDAEYRRLRAIYDRVYSYSGMFFDLGRRIPYTASPPPAISKLLSFTGADLKSVDIESGKFIFKNSEGSTLILTKIKEHSFTMEDWTRAIVSEV